MSCKATLKRGGKKCSRLAKPNGFCAWHNPQPQPVAPIVQKFLSSSCPICLEDLTAEEDAKLHCGHPIHLKCAEQLQDPSCPSCRAPLLPSEQLTEEQIDRMTAQKMVNKEQREEELLAEYLEDEDEEEEGPPEVRDMLQLLDLLTVANTPLGEGREVRDPVRGSAEELAALSWILERKFEGSDIESGDFHQDLHLRYRGYSCYFLHWCAQEANTFLDN